MNRCNLGIAFIVVMLVATTPVQAATKKTSSSSTGVPSRSTDNAASPTGWGAALSTFSTMSSALNDEMTGLAATHQLETDIVSASEGSSQSSSSGQPPTVPNVSNLSTDTYYIDQNDALYKHDATGFTYAVGPSAPFMQPNIRYYADKNSFYIKNGSRFTWVGTFENPYRQLDLRTPSILTVQDIKSFILANDPMSPLVPLAPVYLQAQEEYGVNAEYLVAHSIIESTWGSSQIAHDKNNLFGYSAYDSSPYSSATTFPSKAYAILYEAWFVRKYYLDSDGTYYHGPNLDGMNVDYATDPNWAEKIAAVMGNMKPFSTDGSSSVLSEATTEPVFSYPSGVIGQVTTNGLHVRAGPGLDYPVVDSWNDGQQVAILGWVPGWYEVNWKSNAIAYVSSQYVRMKNLGVIHGDSVNLRAGPSTLSPIMGNLQYATEVELLGQSKDKQWSYVHTMQDVTGYVYSAYIQALQ